QAFSPGMRFLRATASPSFSEERERGVMYSMSMGIQQPAGSAPEAPMMSGALSPSPLELPRVRMQFPEVVFNQLIEVEGTVEVEVKPGEGLGRYTVEAFALDRENFDWQRIEASFEVTQPLAGELTVAPFVLPGDAVLGRLDILSTRGEATAEVQVNGQSVPLWFEDGRGVEPGQALPSGTTLRFVLQPGAVTAIVRSLTDPSLVDVSERLVMEMGKLRHIARRTRLLMPGMEATTAEPRVLEILPLPAFEHSFEAFVQAACENPYGCVEQTCSMLLAQFTGYLYYSQKEPEKALHYENALVVWHKRLKSMELPKGGFSLYPPETRRSAVPDTHYAPLAMKHLQKLPASEQVELRSEPLKALLQDLHAIRRRGMAYYELEPQPQQVRDCEDAYLILKHPAGSDELKTRAADFIRDVLREENGQVFADLEKLRARMKPDWYGDAVLRRYQTAFAAASLLILDRGDDVVKAVSATNYLLSQMNEEGRFYSTVDTAAGLVLFLGLRSAGIVADQAGKSGRVVLNGREVDLAEALKTTERIESLRCVSGLVTARVTSEVIEDWRSFKSDLPVEVRLEKQGQVDQEFEIGDELDLLIKVPRYEAGLLAHICLPDALARVIGGAQVKRFSLDFSGQDTLRIPLAVVGSTVTQAQSTEQIQHWAVIVRNMFKEEQIGNPGLLKIQVA
ncbi:MAG TPA: hypothetical protein VFN23_19390, partial [Ktedonobacteraceae bacterium]|nr:hypothetical protein [Ktedonobacteraceae bacterium]